MNCKICHTPAHKIFSKKVLFKYNADYYKCPKCAFIQTSDPVWLEEAYASAITALDVGLVDRNMVLKNETSILIDTCFPQSKTYIDYAGGYGLFVRIMRDAGYDFYRQDIYCQNLFANHFDIADTATKKFDILTAFEVFEHFNDPMTEIRKMFDLSDTIIFSTKLQPADEKEIPDWWYIAAETGQHIAFYDTKTLEFIAKTFGKKYYFNNENLHLFTSENIESERLNFVFADVKEKKEFFGLKTRPLDFKIRRQSLLQRDYDYIKDLITKKG